MNRRGAGSRNDAVVSAPTGGAWVRLFGVTSALVFVALLVVVDLSYRRWIRRSVARRATAAVADPALADSALAFGGVDLTESVADVIPLPPRDVSRSNARRGG